MFIAKKDIDFYTVGCFFRQVAIFVSVVEVYRKMRCAAPCVCVRIRHSVSEVGMGKRLILVPPPPLPLPLPFCSANTRSYPILQNGSGQSLPHP